MPTLRLGDREKSQIRRAFREAAEKALNNKPFPLTEADFPEFGYSLLDDVTRSHYVWLRENAKELTSAATWHPDFVLENADARYSLTISGVELPTEDIKIQETHPMYLPILEWVQFYCEMKTRVTESMSYMRNVIEHCSSTGQVKRVLSEDILKFLPTYMHSYWDDAERRSRWPSGLSTEGVTEKITELADVLALASISPEKRAGLQVTASRTTI